MRSPPSDARALLLRLARSQELGGLLRCAVQELAQQPGAALVRIWLVDPDEKATLRLTASAGRPRGEGPANWSRVDGEFGTLRIGEGKVGRAAASGALVTVRDVRRARGSITHPDWARREGCRGFVALPLMDGMRVLGVLGVFRRDSIDDPIVDELRQVADHTAAGVLRGLRFATLALRLEAYERESTRLSEALASQQARGVAAPLQVGVLSKAALRALERENLRRALTQCRGRIYGPDGAAELLGVRPTTLSSRIRTLGVERERVRLRH